MPPNHQIALVDLENEIFPVVAASQGQMLISDGAGMQIVSKPIAILADRLLDY